MEEVSHCSVTCPLAIVPASWRRQVFDIVLSHPSVRTTRKLVANKLVWNGLQRQVGTWAYQCIACQSSKVQAHIRAPLEKFSVPHARLDHIHLDLVGPLSPSNGFLTCLPWLTAFLVSPNIFLFIVPTPAVALKP